MELLLKKRHSGRSYDPNRFLSKEEVMSLLEAAAWAPSCYGDEPWRYLVFDKKEHPDHFEKALSCLVPFNQEWARNSSLLLLACGNTEFRKENKPNRWGAYDTGAASENLCLQAVSLGMMAHQMGGFDEKKATSLFSIPETFIPIAMIAVGYERADAPDKDAVRTRRPIPENFFSGTWGQGYR